MYGTGISREGELIDIGVLHNLVEKSGSWYSYKGERIGQGKDNARTFLLQHPEIAADVEAQIRAKLIPAKATMNRGVEAKEAVEAVEA
jgi:recombination protein RecA